MCYAFLEYALWCVFSLFLTNGLENGRCFDQVKSIRKEWRIFFHVTPLQKCWAALNCSCSHFRCDYIWTNFTMFCWISFGLFWKVHDCAYSVESFSFFKIRLYNLKAKLLGFLFRSNTSYCTRLLGKDIDLIKKRGDQVCLCFTPERWNCLGHKALVWDLFKTSRIDAC